MGEQWWWPLLSNVADQHVYLILQAAHHQQPWQDSHRGVGGGRRGMEKKLGKTHRTLQGVKECQRNPTWQFLSQAAVALV